MFRFRRIRQGGAIVYRRAGADVQILLVRSKKKPNEWVFPKGHVWPREHLSRTAQREAKEEGGAVARVIRRVGAPRRFRSGNERVSVQYHVLEATDEVKPQESRDPQWVSPAEAKSLLSYDDAKDLLDQAQLYIREELALQPPPSSSSDVAAEGSNEAEFRKLLLAEHQHVAESYLRNEEDGERRVTFFMTFAAGAAAVLGFLLGERPEGIVPNKMHPLVVGTLAVVGASGVFTFRRVITRNEASDRYKWRPSRSLSR